MAVKAILCRTETQYIQLKSKHTFSAQPRNYSRSTNLVSTLVLAKVIKIKFQKQTEGLSFQTMQDIDNHLKIGSFIITRKANCCAEPQFRLANRDM